MPRDDDNYVALFIDWDNLAISTAVDFAGAIPDVRAIVRAAQRSGTVLLARAYAEWNVSSDRLSVYRAGVEPVYAPTFRFEPEPGSSVARGKSLADPCLVTDCIDTMHLMPDINVFCLVSGDKDLIPIVRLAQLRGKRVVVIGPDFVAAILREMADEYIPYRGLVEVAENTVGTEVRLNNARGQRRVAAPPSRLAPVAATPVARTQATPSRTASAASLKPLPVETAMNGATADGPVGADEPIAEAISTEEALDAAPLFATVGTIVREREQAGKPRLRATNLKDQLLARIPSFDERKYGFPRFKDLLIAAEKAGVIAVSRTGPVQWVASASAPAAPTPAMAPALPSSDPSTGETIAAPDVEPAAVTVDASADGADEEADLDVIRYILDLRDRSRWLTYTYLLTNLLNHLGKSGADSSDAAARTTLNRLVQSGVLVVDREPREIEVSGTHHRVRLCHIVDDHPLVVGLLRDAPAAADSEGEPVAPIDGESAAALAPTKVEASEEAPSSIVETPLPAPIADESPSDLAAAQTPASAEATESPPNALALEESPAAIGDSSPVETEAVEETEGSSRESALEPPATPNTTSTVLTLAESYQILRQVVRDATGTNRPSTGPAAIKNRLVRRLGTFDEHTFGFSKFKDYLLAAERAGAIKVELAGTTARVSLPPE